MDMTVLGLQLRFLVGFSAKGISDGLEGIGWRFVGIGYRAVFYGMQHDKDECYGAGAPRATQA